MTVTSDKNGKKLCISRMTSNPDIHFICVFGNVNFNPSEKCIVSYSH